MARAEAAWLAGHLDSEVPVLEEAYALAASVAYPWAVGEFGYWLDRAGRPPPSPEPAAEPFRLALEGRYAEAAAAWEAIGCWFDAAMALVDSDDDRLVLSALATFGALGSRPAAPPGREPPPGDGRPGALRPQRRKVAERNGLPVDRITEVRVLDPHLYGGRGRLETPDETARQEPRPRQVVPEERPHVLAKGITDRSGADPGRWVGQAPQRVRRPELDDGSSAGLDDDGQGSWM